jgi:N-acetylmuramoyl-L-alanine amidase
MFAWAELDKYIAAFCAWREADATRDGLRAVLHVINNRAKDSKNRWPKTWRGVVLQYEQFSSMTAPGDHQIKTDRVPQAPDPHMVDAYEIADSIFEGNDFDLTQGATHYFANYIAMPSWAASMTFTVQIGPHRFYK